MKRRLFFGILVLCLALAMLAPAAYATETEEAAVTAQSSADSGTCGEGLTWVYKDHVLTVSGSGDMDDGCPWSDYKDKIEKVVFTGGVTKVGAKAFEDFDWLEFIDFGDSMREIGSRAFYDCNDIVEIRLPKTFRLFGEECFRNCASLERVICEGGMPSFRSSCLYTGNYISVFYPPNNPWPQEYVSQLISSFGGKLGIMMASEDIMENGFAQEPQQEETEAVEETEAAVETIAETVPETTAAETISVVAVVTEPQTEPEETTVPETEETTLPSEEPEHTEPGFLFTEATEPDVAEEKAGTGWIGLVMIAGVITFVIAGAMIFRNTTRRGGRYRE